MSNGMRKYHVREYIEYIPTDLERQRYGLEQNVFYGEIEEIDFDNGILSLESVTSTGMPDQVECFQRKMTILEAHKVNKLSFEVPPSLQKAFQEQLDKESRNETEFMKKEALDYGRTQITSLEDKENDPNPNQDDGELLTDGEPISDSSEVLTQKEQSFEPAHQIPSENDQILAESGKKLVEFEDSTSENDESPAMNHESPVENSQVSVNNDQFVGDSEPNFIESMPICDENEQETDQNVLSSTEGEAVPVQNDKLNDGSESDDNLDPPAIDEPHVTGDNQPEKQQKKDSGKVKEKKAPRERMHNNITINNNHTNLRRTARQHKPVYKNVRYEYDDTGAYVQIVDPVTFMTQEQSYRWFKRNFPTKKQAKSVGIQYYKKFRANKRMTKLYSDSDSSGDEDNNETREESDAEPTRVGDQSESESESDESFKPDEDVTDGFSTDDDSFRLTNSSKNETANSSKNETANSSNNETGISLKNISKIYSKKKANKGDRKSLEKRMHQKNIILNPNNSKGRANVKKRREKGSIYTSSEDSDSEVEVSRSSQLKSKNLTVKKGGRGRPKKQRSESEQFSSEDDRRSKKPILKKSDKSVKIKKESKAKEHKKRQISHVSSSDDDRQIKNRNQKKSEKEAKKKRQTLSDSDDTSKILRKSNKKLRRSSQPSESEDSSYKENVIKIRNQSKKAKSGKPLKSDHKSKKKVKSPDTVDYEEDFKRFGKTLKGDQKGKKKANSPVSFEEELPLPFQEIGHPRTARQPVDTPLTTKHASKNHPTAANTSLLKMFSPVSSPKQAKQDVLNRCLRKLGDYSKTDDAEYPGSVVYVENPDLDTVTIHGIFDLEKEAERGPMVVDGDSMVLKLTWGSANLTYEGEDAHGRSETVHMKVNKDFHLKDGSSYTMTTMRGALINFKCSIPPDESFME